MRECKCYEDFGIGIGGEVGSVVQCVHWADERVVLIKEDGDFYVQRNPDCGDIPCECERFCTLGFGDDYNAALTIFRDVERHLLAGESA